MNASELRFASVAVGICIGWFCGLLHGQWIGHRDMELFAAADKAIVQQCKARHGEPIRYLTDGEVHCVRGPSLQ